VVIVVIVIAIFCIVLPLADAAHLASAPSPRKSAAVETAAISAAAHLASAPSRRKSAAL
jgi:hypothetical protein